MIPTAAEVWQGLCLSNFHGKNTAKRATLESLRVANFVGGIPLPVTQRLVRKLCRTLVISA